MRQIFLGRFVHWLVLLVIIALGWLAGEVRLHVTSFNLFVVLTCLGTLAVLFFILFTTRPGELVTREPIEDVDDTDQDGQGAA